MASSRIFVKGLPPTMTEQDFKLHFSQQSAITDAKLIPHRRIGYVGYKTNKEAATAIKYFNKSFIRMSRISVEHARPVSDRELPISRKAQREKEKEVQRAQKAAAAEAAGTTASSLLKRKHNDIDDSNPKLKEFLQVMQPQSKSKGWTTETLGDESLEEPPKKIRAVEFPENESDNEYETVPKKSSKGHHMPSLVAQANLLPAAPTEFTKPEPSLVTIPKILPIADPTATDDEWMRSRTNRLLDLVDPADSIVPLASDAIEQRAPPTVVPTTVASNEILAEEEHNTNGEPKAEVSAEAPSNTEEVVCASGRLFVRNLPYTATEEDLRRHFEAYGSLKEVHLPLDAAGNSKGFVLIQFEEPASAAEAYHNIDGEPFQGRLLHVLPAAAKRENKLDEFAIAKLPLKKQKQIRKKAEASTTTFNWNSLYMNQDAVNSSIADRLGVSKAELLDPTSSDAGVKQAIAETSIINETKSYFINNGVDLNAFKKQERGDTAILVKNFPYGTTVDELRRMFEEFGQVVRVLMPPSGTTAIVEYAQAPQARAAFGNLAYRRIKDLVLYLEKAPKNIFKHGSSKEVVATTDNTKADAKLAAADLLEKEPDLASSDTSTLFVKNLDFSTTSARLAERFAPLDGFMSARVNTKTDPKKPGQVLSMGFGFIEFRNKAQAQAGLIAMDGNVLDNHKLVIKASHKGLDAAEERRKEDNAKKASSKRTKIIVKNLPFEASKKDVRKLFGTYGQLRSVRVPHKYDQSARGFAFVDFTTAREAENALEALKDTHLLGRRLVLEFAAEDPTDAEEEIEKMQQKIGKQVNKVALQKLTVQGRKKFNIEGNENEVQ